MSQISDLFEEVKQDPKLYERFKSAPNKEALVKDVLAEAKARGIDLQASEVREFISTEGEEELSDRELSSVTGGNFDDSTTIYDSSCGCGP